MSLKDKYNQLDHKSKTYVVWAGAFVVVILLVMLLKPSKDEVVQEVEQNLEVTPFIASADDVDIESLNVRLQSTERTLLNTQSGITQTNKEISELKAMLSSEDRLQTAPEILYDLQKRENQRDKQIEELKQMILDSQSVVVMPTPTIKHNDDLAKDELVPELGIDGKEDEGDVFLFEEERKPVPTPVQPSDYNDTYSSLPTDPLELLRVSHDIDETDTTEPASNLYVKDDRSYNTSRFDENMEEQGHVNRISIIQSNEPSTDNPDDGPKYIGKRINAGSLTPLTLLTGVDAPTGKRAADKLTATFVVTGDVRLPDGSELNLDSCRVLTDVQAHKTEARAYFRPYKLSCKFDYGDVDMPITGSISGPDGALGIKGHLVNPSGKAVLYSTLTSGIDLAAAWLDSEIETIELSSGDTLSTGNSGVVSSTAPLREYYLNEAKELQPYVQVRPLVQASMIVLDTVTLELLKDETNTKKRKRG